MIICKPSLTTIWECEPNILWMWSRCNQIRCQDLHQSYWSCNLSQTPKNSLAKGFLTNWYLHSNSCFNQEQKFQKSDKHLLCKRLFKKGVVKVAKGLNERKSVLYFAFTTMIMWIASSKQGFEVSGLPNNKLSLECNSDNQWVSMIISVDQW